MPSASSRDKYAKGKNGEKEKPIPRKSIELASTSQRKHVMHENDPPDVIFIDSEESDHTSPTHARSKRFDQVKNEYKRASPHVHEIAQTPAKRCNNCKNDSINNFSKPQLDHTGLVHLTDDHMKLIRDALNGPVNGLNFKFNVNITRRDIKSLDNGNWVNDEIINFYMNLLTERSEKKHGLPSVYGMNSFFLKRFLVNGNAYYNAVQRWTSQVNIFAKDIILVPVHLHEHWSMAIIHLKNRSIKYYDSMCRPNPSVLNALELYLQYESMDKLRKPFDTSHFEVESVSNVPRQMNGSDCGVFSCMFAEYICRNKNITFSQEHMVHFRNQMILEILQGELMQ